jgi:hypothetical protein
VRPRAGAQQTPETQRAAGLWSAPSSRSAASVKSEAYGETVLGLRNASKRDEVSDILITYFQSFFFNVAFFVVRKQQLQGYRGAGKQLREERVPGISLPLDQRSTVREVIASRMPYQGPLGVSPTDASFTVQLGYSPTQVAFTPVQIRGKVVGVVYADTPHHELDPDELSALLVEVEAAYEAIILTSKS